MITPSEAVIAGHMMEGENEEDARRLARTALGSLVAAGFVLKIRSGDDFIPYMGSARHDMMQEEKENEND